MSQDYNELESQIGEVGDAAPAEDTSKGLGKLKYAKEVLGQKPDLNEDEQASLDAFLERSKSRKGKTVVMDDPSVVDGWLPINREEMGIRSMFYPAEWEFFIKPATVQAVKNWTSIDEDRPDQVNKVFNDIIKSCVKINTHSEIGAGWAQINSWDRFWFTLKVREYTFSEGEAKISFTDNCSECDAEIKYELDANSLVYEFPDDDLIEKYWCGTEWHIDPSEYGVHHDPIVLYTPKLGKDEGIIEWASAKLHAKQKIDETFIKFLVWMLPKASKDINILDNQIQKCLAEYKSWDEDMFMFMNDVITNITINPTENLKTKCPHCGGESVGAVQFPNGVKSLFTRQDTTRRKFGSK